MNKTAKRRCIVLALLLLVFVCSAVGYSYRLYSYDITDGVINLKNDIGEVYVDGEDFTLFGWLLGGIFNIMMWPVLYAIFAVVFLCVCLIGLILFRSTCLGDKTEKISSREALVASWMFEGMVLLSLLFGFIMPDFIGLIPLFTYTGIWGLCVGCIYVWPLRKRAKDLSANEMNETHKQTRIGESALVMNKAAKTRCIVLALLLLVFTYFAVGYSYELYDQGIAAVEVSIVRDSLYVIYAIITGLVCLIGIILLRLIGFRDKTERISIREALVASWIFWGMVIVSLLVGSILQRFTGLFPLLTHTAIWGFCVYFIYVWPLRKSAGV